MLFADYVPTLVRLERFSDLWGHAVEPLMPDRSKVRDQIKRDTGAYTARSRSRFDSSTRLRLSSFCFEFPIMELVTVFLFINRQAFDRNLT